MLKGIKIKKEELNNINEFDIMFITNPGRMGDEDGSTFIIKNNNTYIVYRVDGWMYGERNDDFISMNIMFDKFPKLKEMLDNYNDNKYINDKYRYIYMGFGNGVSIDKTIYEEFYRYLLEEVKKNDKYNIEDGNNYNPSLNYSAFPKALDRFTYDNNIIIKYK